VVDRIKNLLPQAQATVPAGTLKFRSDRPGRRPIRASVSDVEFLTDVTIALVVIGDLLFFGICATTIIPSVAADAVVVGTFGVMYLPRRQASNLTLMALTISTGFVVMTQS